jgi:hypothetical protein
MNQILPQRIDNTCRGHPLAVWLFVPVVVLKTGIALGTVFNGRGAAQSADGIPLDSFGASGAEAVLTLFAAERQQQHARGDAHARHPVPPLFARRANDREEPAGPEGDAPAPSHRHPGPHPPEDPDERFANKPRIRAGFGHRRSFEWRFEAIDMWTRSRNTINDKCQTSDNIIDIRVKQFLEEGTAGPKPLRLKCFATEFHSFPVPQDRAR